MALLALLALALLVLCPSRSWSAETNTLASTFEQIAKTNRHFAHTVIIEYSTLRLPMSGLGEKDASRFRSWAIDQLFLLQHLKAASKQRDALIGLLEHENPKVRTLALGALFQNLDARDLPLFASLLDDRAPTFLYLTDETDSSGGMSSSADQERPQSVEGVASAMLMFWGVPSNDRSENRKWLVEKKDFNHWAQQNLEKVRNRPKPERRISASRTEPELALYQADTKRVLADLQTLPLFDRALTAFHLYQWRHGQYFDTDALRKAALVNFKELGHAEVVRILRFNREDRLPAILPPFAKSYEDDPLMGTEWFSPRYVQGFILSYGRELLLPEDVPFLLEKEKSADRFERPNWVIAAADLAYRRSPAEARAIIQDALPRFPLTDGSHGHNRAALLTVLWRHEGMKVAADLVEHFYVTTADGLGQYSLLGSIERAAQPNTLDLLAIIVADKRFEQLKPYVLKELLDIVNRSLPKPLETDEEIKPHLNPNDATPATQALWRERLRQHFANPRK